MHINFLRGGIMGESIKECKENGQYLKALEKQKAIQKRSLKIYIIENNILKHYTCLEKRMMDRQRARTDSVLTLESGVISLSYGKYNKSTNSWKFSLRLEKYLKTDVDYFILVALDDNFEGIMHVWKIPSDRYNDRTVTIIKNDDKFLKKYEQYEVPACDIV